MTRQLGALNENPLSRGAGTFPAGHSRTITITNAEPVIVGPAAEFPGAVFAVLGLNENVEGEGVLFGINADGTKAVPIAGATDLLVDTDGTVSIPSGTRVSVGVNTATEDIRFVTNITNPTDLIIVRLA